MALTSVSAKTYSFTNGTANDAAPVDASFTTVFNNDSSLVTGLNKVENGNFTETSTIILNQGYGGSAPSANATFSIERGTLANTAVRWNETSDIWEFTNDGTTYFPILTAANIQNFNTTAAPVYATAATFTVARINCTNSALDGYIRKTTSTTVDISTTGLNGVAQSSALAGTVGTGGAPSTTITGSGTAFNTDFQVGDVIWTASGARRITNIGGATTMTVESNVTLANGTAYKRGGEAPSTWYYLYAVTDGTTPGLLLSTRNVAGGDTLADAPTGYTKSRQLAFAVRNDSSSNIIPFTVADGWPQRPRIKYDVTYDLGAGGGTTNVLTTGAATAYTDIECSSFVPPISKLVSLHGNIGDISSRSGNLRPKGSSHNGLTWTMSASITFRNFSIDMETNASQQLEYDWSAAPSAGLTLNVVGYVVTEL